MLGNYENLKDSPVKTFACILPKWIVAFLHGSDVINFPIVLLKFFVKEENRGDSRIKEISGQPPAYSLREIGALLHGIELIM